MDIVIVSASCLFVCLWIVVLYTKVKSSKRAFKNLQEEFTVLNIKYKAVQEYSTRLMQSGASNEASTKKYKRGRLTTDNG